MSWIGWHEGLNLQSVLEQLFPEWIHSDSYTSLWKNKNKDCSRLFVFNFSIKFVQFKGFFFLILGSLILRG